jgi:hypothetical protein
MVHPPEPNSAFSLLSAMIAGDARIEDGVRELRKEGIESLEDALSTLANGLKDREERRKGALQPVDFQQLRRSTPPEVVSRIVQNVPDVPFRMNGTSYDPEDITRFNGQELHFVAGPHQDHMLVVDNRNMIVDWLQFAYLDRYIKGGHETAVNATSMHEGPQTIRSAPVSLFWDDIDLTEYAITVNKDRGYRDLTDLDFFWPSGQTWNDRISSISMYGTGVAELHEHTNYFGQSFTWVLPFGTPYGEVRNLHTYGWGDRASAIATW